jgi:oxygen-independent coproporphyrinogen-3 oxidase
MSYAGIEDRIGPYVQAVCDELAMLPPADTFYASEGVRPTLFLGGGTPSLLMPAQVGQLVQAAAHIIPVQDAEVTLEVNPGTLMGPGGGNGRALTPLAYFCALREHGVTRVSLGVQSLEDTTLRVLERIHSAAEAEQCVRDAQAAGFESVSLDLISGLPGQTVEQWHATLHRVAGWGVDHLSLYSLILEEQAPMHAQVLRSEVVLPDDDIVATMYELAMEFLPSAGFVQYEISNWARMRSHNGGSPARILRSAHICHHNVAYWLNDDYLGVGAGAHGHIYPQRYANLHSVDAYIAAIQAGRRPIAYTTPLTLYDICTETMFMGLRLVNGVRFDHFRTRCGVDMERMYGDTLNELEASGLLERDAGAVRLTQRGMMLGNQVFERFV